jgi:hypothetical protein
VVVDGRAGVDNHVAADDGAGIQDRAGRNHRSVANRDIAGDDAPRMDGNGELLAFRHQTAEDPGPDRVVAERHDHRVVLDLAGFVHRSHDRRVHVGVSVMAAIVVEERERTARAQGAENVSDHLTVSAGADDENHERTLPMNSLAVT